MYCVCLLCVCVCDTKVEKRYERGRRDIKEMGKGKEMEYCDVKADTLNDLRGQRRSV